MSKDWHAQGQHDREKSRKDGWVDLVIGGGGSPHYNPPSDPDDKDEYDAGWENGYSVPSEIIACRFAPLVRFKERPT